MYDACSDCVVVLALGDLVVRRHFVRGLEGAAQLFIIKLSEGSWKKCEEANIRLPGGLLKTLL